MPVKRLADCCEITWRTLAGTVSDLLPLAKALKFTKQGYVNFGSKVNDTELEFFVEDTGIGMDRPQSAIGQVGCNIQLRPGQLQGDQDPNQNRNRSPDDAPGDETFNRIIVVPRWCIHAFAPFSKLEIF